MNETIEKLDSLQLETKQVPRLRLKVISQPAVPVPVPAPIPNPDIYCIEKTKKTKERCKNKKVHGDLCGKHFSLKRKAEEKNLPPKEKEEVDESVETKECTSARHKNSMSGFPQDSVPIEYFRIPNKPEAELYKTCSFCRRWHDRVKNERIKQSEELQKADPNYGVCCSDSHDVIGVSLYSRNRVPVAMFDKKGRQKSNECSDCRKYQRAYKNKGRLEKKALAEQNGQHLCTRCFNPFYDDEMGENVDGTMSTTCKECKEKSNEGCQNTSAELRRVVRNIRVEKFKEDGCSCYRCKKIFLKPLHGANHQRTLDTYEKDGNRYVDFEGKSYLTKDFLEMFEKDLELRTVDFDHLPEDEQRKRHIIKPDEAFIEKRGLVVDMPNEYEMRKEAIITQHLCCYCHVVVTVERETYNRDYSPRYREKDRYVKSLKRKGCEFCGFKDDNVARYFEFDHIDPKDKEFLISVMVRKGKFSLEDLIRECRKCRVLCKACHRIRTQR